MDALTANTDDKESSANQNGKESSEKNKAEIPSLEKELHKGSRKEEPVTGNSEEEILRSNNISLAQEFLDIKKTEPQREVRNPLGQQFPSFPILKYSLSY